MDASFDRVAEVEALLAADETVLGKYWDYESRGLTPQQMAEAEGTKYPNWVWNYRKLVSVLRDGEVPTSPAPAADAARRIRAWLRSKPLSEELREALTAQERLLTSRAEDAVAQAEESARATDVTRKAEAEGRAGIYVYTLPHYLRHPFDPKTGRTLLKVGHSSVDALYRADSQTRVTALPEDPWLLRVYPAEASAEVEQKFHSALSAADHSGVRTQRGGREWFLTSTKFLDHLASLFDLPIMVVNDFEVADE